MSAYQTIEISNIKAAYQAAWADAVGTYEPVWHDPSNKDPSKVTEYQHTTRPEYVLLKSVPDQLYSGASGDEFDWVIAKVLDDTELKTYVNDPSNFGFYGVFAKAPWEWRVQGEGWEDVPCYACAPTGGGGVVQIQTAVNLHKFNVVIKNPLAPEVPYGSGVGPVGGVTRGHAFSGDWSCSGSCAYNVDTVRELNTTNGSSTATGGNGPSYPKIYNQHEFQDFSDVWHFALTGPSAGESVSDTSFYEGPCFPPEGSYPGVVPATHVVSSTPNQLGMVSSVAGEWMKTDIIGRGASTGGDSLGYAFWRFQFLHTGPEVFKRQSPNSFNSLWNQLKNHLNYVRPTNLAAGAPDPSKPLEVPTECFRFVSDYVTIQQDNPGGNPISIPIDLGSPPPSGVNVPGDIVLGPVVTPVSVELVGPPRVVIAKQPGIYDDPGTIPPTTPSITVNLEETGLYFIDYTYCRSSDNTCATVSREVLVVDSGTTGMGTGTGTPTINVTDNGDGTATVTSTETLLDEDLNPITGVINIHDIVCVIDSKGRVHCVDTGDPTLGQTAIPLPAAGPTNLSGLTQAIPLPASGPSGLAASIIPVSASGPSGLTASVIPVSAAGPLNLTASVIAEPVIAEPVGGPTGLTAQSFDGTTAPKYKGFVFDPRTSSISGPFVSKNITTITTKDNSSEMYAVSDTNEILKTVVTDLNDTYFDPVSDPFTDLTSPLINDGVILSESGQGYMYRNMYKASPFAQSVKGSGNVVNPLYFKDAYLSIAETNWLHLGDEHNEKQVHRVDLRFHKNSVGHLFLYVQNDDGKVKGQYKGALKEHMKVFTNLRGRGFKICMMIAAHPDHPWAMREMAIGHLYGKSF